MEDVSSRLGLPEQPHPCHGLSLDANDASRLPVANLPTAGYCLCQRLGRKRRKAHIQTSPSDIPVTWALSKGRLGMCRWFPTCGFQKHYSDQYTPSESFCVH